MSQLTKKALAASLEKILIRKPLDKVTIKDITEDCGVNRMTFYYHFQDIYDLVEWMLYEEAIESMKGIDAGDWERGCLQVFYKVRENKSVITNIYNSSYRSNVSKYLLDIVHGLIYGVVSKAAKELSVDDEQVAFITKFYQYGFVGIVMEWISDGMKQDPKYLVRYSFQGVRDTLQIALKNIRTIK